MWLGAFVAGLMLALSVPSIALAAGVATFSGNVPRGTISSATPKVSITVYDKYGVSKTASNYSMTIDGVKVAAKFAYVSGFGTKKFVLSYQVPSALAVGFHMVNITVHDLRSLNSSAHWGFTNVSADAVPPVTVSSVVSAYTDSAAIFLIATDNAGGSGVAHTYFTLDGVTSEGSIVYTAVPGLHTLMFWSVDKAGNVEVHHSVTFTVAAKVFSHAAPAISCTVVGCHGGMDVATIHWALKCAPCHAPGVTPTTNCITCHTNNPPNHDPHVPILSVGTPTCTTVGCHPAALAVIHGNCATCHAPAAGGVIPVATINAAVSTGGATCETCHGARFAATHVAPNNTAHIIAGSCFTTLCHNASDVGALHTTGDNPPGCVVCHDGNPAHLTTACGTCHPNLQIFHDFTHVDATGTKSSACTACHGTDIPTVHANVGCICHTASFLRAEMTPLLAAGHAECVDCHKNQFAPHGFASSTTTPAVSGHNTTTFPGIGAHSAFDGSEGVVVKDSAGTTITQDWLLPTADVFWSQSNLGSLSVTDSPAVAMGPLASAIRTDVGWGSVITCQDCHTNLSTALGPQGANVGQVGLDPRFPDDWTLAEITTFDPTGMRSILTTAGSPNPYYDKSLSAPAGSGYSSGDIPVRTICQKCHKLTNFHQGEPAQTRAGRSQLSMGLSNEAHMEHHGDQIFGQANCVGCHVAIPHGWKRPRLLVYSSDPAPYLADQPTTQTVVTAPVGSGLPSGMMGNWIYGVSSAGGTSQHLDALNANPDWTKEATSGPVAGGWDQSVYGTEWGAPGTEAVQTNCTACTAAGTTHVPGQEGIPVGEPTWN